MDVVLGLAAMGAWGLVWWRLAGKLKSQGRGWFTRNMIASTCGFLVFLIISAVAMSLGLIQGPEEADNPEARPTPPSINIVLPPTETSVVAAVGAKPTKKTIENDDGCRVVRYHFSEHVMAMSIEFKCNRTNVAWSRSDEPGLRHVLDAENIKAKRAIIALTGGDGSQLNQLMAGRVFKGERAQKTAAMINGSCTNNFCLLQFSGGISN